MKCTEAAGRFVLAKKTNAAAAVISNVRADGEY